MHPHVEIIALGIGRADVLHIGLAADDAFDSASAFGGAVAARAFGRRAVELDQHGVIDFATESCVDRVEISLVSVRRDLNALRQARGEIVDKLFRRYPSVSSSSSSSSSIASKAAFCA